MNAQGNTQMPDIEEILPTPDRYKYPREGGRTMVGLPLHLRGTPGRVKQQPRRRTKEEHVNPSLRFQVLARDKFCCQYCGRSAPDVKLQVDHIKPVAGGGTNDPKNLVTACAECNIGKGSTLINGMGLV